MKLQHFRTGALVLMLVAASLYVDSHVQSDIETVRDYKKCMNESSSLLSYSSLLESENQKCVADQRSPIRIGQEIIASAVNFRIVYLHLNKTGQATLDKNVCKKMNQIYDLFDERVLLLKTSKRLTDYQSEYLFILIKSERQFFETKCKGIN